MVKVYKKAKAKIIEQILTFKGKNFFFTNKIKMKRKEEKIHSFVHSLTVENNLFPIERSKCLMCVEC